MRDVLNQKKLYSIMDNSDPFSFSFEKAKTNTFMRQLVSAKPEMNKKVNLVDVNHINKQAEQ